MKTDEPLVQVSGVSKKFCRSLRRSLWYATLDIGAELLASSNKTNRLRKNEFWALQGIDFELRRGDSLALIGSNGAGKSTLLRMLNGLIKPTTGRIEIDGRIQALIALGVGFSPVLSGRDNIYISASVLGMSKRETDRVFDSIVEFSGIEEFIETPVQYYSSGMLVRLGFSVAAHMEPDVLLIDEVLAVGDDAFRRKALTKTYSLLDKATVIFVSHNMNHVEQICNRAVYLRRDGPIVEGPVSDTIAEYLTDTNAAALDSHESSNSGFAHQGTGEAQFTEIELLVDGQPADTLWSGGNLKVRARFNARESLPRKVWLIAAITDPATGSTILTNGIETQIKAGKGIVEIEFPKLTLRPRAYPIDLIISEPALTLDRVNGAAQLSVLDRPGRETNYSAIFKKDLVYWPGECRVLASDEADTMRKIGQEAK